MKVNRRPVVPKHLPCRGEAEKFSRGLRVPPEESSASPPQGRGFGNTGLRLTFTSTSRISTDLGTLCTRWWYQAGRLPRYGPPWRTTSGGLHSSSGCPPLV